VRDALHARQSGAAIVTFFLNVGRTFVRALVAWWEDNALRLGASVSYYTLFAIAPMLLVVIAVAGSIFGAEAVRGQVASQIEGLVGPEGALAVQALLKGASQPSSNALAMVVGGVAFVLAACGAFLELRAALNTIWRVQPSPVSGVRDFFVNRLRSFGLVVAIGFLLLISLVISAALAALHEWLSGLALVLPTILQVLNVIVSLLVTAMLFALMFRVLPDVRLRHRDVAVGAMVTAILFTVGKQLIGFYLGRSATTSSYGPAGAVIVLLLWVYYSSQIVLIGAEFTRLWSERFERLSPPPPKEPA